MSIYLYRRPENTSAADLYERVGRTLLMGCDLFATDLVTYYDQTIITQKPSNDSLFITIWNVVKLILAPLGIVGAIFLTFSESYSIFTANIEVNGIVSYENAVSQIWKRVHDTSVVDTSVLGTKDIWEYVEEVSRKYLESINISKEISTIDRETGEIEVRQRISLPKTSWQRSGIPIPISTKSKESPINTFKLKFGIYANRLRRDLGEGRREGIKNALLKKPHRFYILMTARSSRYNKVKIAYLDSKKQLAVVDHTFVDMDALELAIDKCMNKSFHRTRLQNDYHKLRALLEKGKAICNSLGKYVSGLYVCSHTHRYYRNSQFSRDLIIKHCYPIYLDEKELRARLAESIRNDCMAFSSQHEPSINVSDRFLRLSQTLIPGEPACSTEQVCDAIFAIVNDIPDSDPRAPFYRIAGNALCSTIWQTPEENWSDLVSIFKSKEYSVIQFLKLLERVYMRSTEATLYEFRKERELKALQHHPSLKGELLQRRNRAAELFADSFAEQNGCSSTAVLRHLAHQGVGLSLPHFTSEMPLLPSDVDVDRLFDQFRLWLTPERLQLHRLALKTLPQDREVLDAITKPFMDVEPYRSLLEAAKSSLADSLEPIARGRIYLTLGAKEPPENGTEIHAAAIDIGVDLQEQLEEAKKELDLQKYCFAKESLIYNALEIYDREIEKEREDVAQGKLGDWYSYPTMLRILEARGFLTDGCLNETAVRAYIE